MKLQKIREKITKEISELILKPTLIWIYKYQFKHIASLEKNIIVKVKDIKAWYGGNRYSEISFQGIIKGGDWSSKIMSLEDKLKTNPKYRSIQQRYCEGIQWKETTVFKERYSDKIESGTQVKGKNELVDLEKFYTNTYDKLYNSLKERGVVAASESEPDIDPIYIMIDKNGEILYTTDGNHRLFMCIILQIEKIPVKVWMRHKEWQKKRDYILSNKGQNIKAEYKKYLSHPDISSELTDG